MQKPLLILQPSLINAIIPSILKNLFISIIICIAFFILYLPLTLLKIIVYNTTHIILSLLAVLLIITIIPLIIELIILKSTRYYFFRTHIIHEFKFINIKRKSVPYSQIVNVSNDISLWDRFCKAGDITLHTAEDEDPDIKLKYIKKPKIVENAIYKMVSGKGR